MCGIAGVIDPIADRAAVRVSMLNEAQEHRGPDHRVVARAGVFTIGNTRLAIQDPTVAGNQPFVSPDGRYLCVFNGEIYNHRQLADRFRLPVRKACDGEIIPHLWAKLGTDSLTELRGMFAIAVVDTLEGHLYLARDLFGIKPLYWRPLPDGSLAFASEVRPLAHLAPSPGIDQVAVARYLNYGAMAADQSPFSEIRALPPNSVAVARPDSPVNVRPIHPGGPFSVGKPPSLERALTESIDLHMAADVPTALLLSGGVDSAMIAGVARSLGRDLHCLTVATEEASDETPGAEQTTRRYGHRFQRVPATLNESDVTRFFQAMQRPSVDGLNTYLICKAVHEAGFKVVLSGLGGDEAVGGYRHFRLLRYLPMLRALDTVPLPLGSALAKIATAWGVAHETKVERLLAKTGPRGGPDLSLLQRELFPAPLVSELTGVGLHRLAPATDAPVWSAWNPGGGFRDMAAAEAAAYLQAMLLPDADTFSMAWSVELRVPFVDSHVFCAAADSVRGGKTVPTKAAIGAALGDPYLKDLAAQPKRGFSAPMGPWLEGPLAPLVTAANEAGSPVWSVVDRDRAMRAGLVPVRPRRRWSETWALTALNAWLDSWAVGPA
jgi:asparagine synthase (glutamine-hydrolysing)